MISQRRLALTLTTIFLFSGFASLIYQVCWQRILTLVYGVGAVATTVVVSVYMLGLGVGALLGGKLAEKSTRLIRAYVFIELSLAVFGALSIPLLSVLGKFTAGSPPSIALAASFLFFSIPTTLMGATLPILVQFYAKNSGRFLNSVSLLYFVNTLGAAFGSAATSFLLISFFGLDVSVYLAVAINLLLALSALSLNKEVATDQSISEPEEPEEPLKYAKLLVLLTGFLAVGYEIVWFRLLKTLLKASSYTFSSVLCVYLVGLALGSLLVKYLPKEFLGGRRNLFFLTQTALAVSVALSTQAYFYLTTNTSLRSLTRWTFDRTTCHPVLEKLSSASDWFGTLDLMLWPCYFVLIPALFMGAGFPLISSLSRSRLGSEGKDVGGVYFWMILGNVLGGFVTGFVLLAQLGTEHTLQLFIGLGLLFVLGAKFAQNKPLEKAKPIFLGGFLVSLVFLFPGEGELYYLAVYPPPDGQVNRIVFDEGVNSVVTSYSRGENVHSYIDGLIHGGRSASYYMEVLESLTWSASSEDILVIGFGTGSLCQALLESDHVTRITVVELNQDLLDNISKFPQISQIINDPRVEIVIDDGRRYLQRSERNFDLVFMDPLRSTTSHSNNLYSQEFFQLVATRLKEKGVLMVWLDEFRTLPNTLFSVFPYARCYWFFGLFSKSDFPKEYRERQAILERFPPDIQKIIPPDSDYTGSRDILFPLVKDYPINKDMKPWCEYYAGQRFRFGPRQRVWELP